MVKILKPITPARRFMTLPDFSELGVYEKKKHKEKVLYNIVFRKLFLQRLKERMIKEFGTKKISEIKSKRKKNKLEAIKKKLQNEITSILEAKVKRGELQQLYERLKSKKKIKPEKKLLVRIHNKAGRNNLGRITSRHRSAGNKKLYRLVDFKRNKDNISALVKTIEYDPYRTARIAKIVYEDGQKSYILAPLELKVGDRVISGENVDIKPGNALPLKSIPTGTFIHNIELKPGRGGKLVRSAGTSAQVLAKEGRYAHVRLPSGEVRLILLECKASIGQLSNSDSENITIGKAGRNRWKGKRPHVRGVATNPCDHPHGGGESKATPGRPSVTPWGKPTKGYRTRKRNKYSDKYIIKSRHKK